MRRLIVTSVRVWEEDIPDIADIETEVEILLHTPPDYEDLEVEEANASSR